MIPGSANPLLLKSAAAAAGGYQIERSLRFNSSDSAYLSRTPALAGNRRTWTFSSWAKRSSLGVFQSIFNCIASDASYYTQFIFETSDKFVLYDNLCPGGVAFTTTQVFRDTSAWFYFLLYYDTTQSTASAKAKLYINGIEVTQFDADNRSSLTADSSINRTAQHVISGRLPYTGGSSGYLSGYLADVHFIDGQALTPSSFTEVSATTGQLIPKKYTGSFGTNGFWLKFSDNSAATATTLGKDYSGNSNNWTPNNFSVTAGSGNDSLVDTPTSAGTDTGVGGQVTGNYCTWNPLETQLNLTNGNLDVDRGTSSWASCKATIGLASGKWYYEYTVNSGSSNQMIGVFQTSVALPAIGAHGYMTVSASGWGYQLDGNKSNANSFTGTGTTATAGDVLMVAFDVDAGKIWFGKNGTWIGSGAPASGTNAAFTNLSGTISPAVCLFGAQSGSVNFGARVFAYQAPSGFRPIVDTLLPSPVVAKPSTVMDVKLYTGNGSTQTISGLGFSPDLVWIKSRSQGLYHFLVDTVRGNTKTLSSNTTDGESFATETVINSFDSSGFTLNADDGAGYYGWNMNSASLAAWCWDAGSSTVSNPDGSITSQVRANPSAGFSIVTWTGNGNATIGHGLGVAPQLIICKKRDGAADWQTGHASIGWTKRLALNLTTAEETTVSAWNNTAPTSTVFSVGNTSNFGGSMVSYCFAPVAGYSSFGSYTGNGSASDGPFVFCNFRPRWVLVKSTGSAENWFLLDSARNTYNAVNSYLMPNSPSAEDPNNSTVNTDFLSNGFKLRASTSALNSNGVTYIYCAFAESPFQYARAR